MVRYSLTAKSLTLYVSGESPRVYDADSRVYKEGVSLIKGGRADELGDLLEKVNRVVCSVDGMSVENDVVFVDGESVPCVFGDKLKEMARMDLPVDSWLNFWRLLRDNPSYNSVRELADCLERNHHPLLPDGRFLAWKGVRTDFKDKYSGKFDNSVGNIVSVPRNEVDDNREMHCSNGLHVATYEYASNYAGCDGVLVEVAVNPANVVSVPTDSSFQKMRVTEYEVLAVSKNGARQAEYVVNDYVACQGNCGPKRDCKGRFCK